MRYLLILSLLSCEESSPNISGEKGILTFSTKTQNNFGEYWTPSHLVATHSLFNLYVKGWEVENQAFDSTEKQKASYKPFLERYEVQDFDSVKHKMKYETFTFETDVPIVATETTQASTDHRGSIDLLSKQVGTFSIKAHGLDSDNIHVEFAEAAYWKAGPARKSLIYNNYIQSEYHQRICIYGTGSVDLFYGMFDKKERFLFGRFPQILFSTTSESISLDQTEDLFTINVNEKLTEDIKIDLTVQDVFGETVISELPSVQICPAGKDFVTGFSMTGILSEKVEMDFNHLSEKELQKYTTSMKEAKRKSPLRNFLKDAKKNKGVAWTSIIPEINSEIPTLNVPITIEPQGGLVFKAEDVITYSSKDELLAIKKHGQPSLTVISGTPVFIVYPHEQEYKISLKSMGYQEQLILPLK